MKIDLEKTATIVLSEEDIENLVVQYKFMLQAVTDEFWKHRDTDNLLGELFMTLEDFIGGV